MATAIRRRRRPTAQVSYAHIRLRADQPPLQGTLPALEESLRPGKTVVRYDRLWRMAQHRTEDGFIVGRIGFERSGQPVWNEEEKDFDVGWGGGATSRFVINTETFKVAFQLRTGLIAPGTFRYNFQALLNEETPWQWRVVLQGVAQPPWEDWRDEVDRVTKLTIKMVRPNPVFPGDQVEQLFQGAKLQAVNMAMTAPPDEGINLDDEFIEQAIELAKDHGSYKAEGVRVEDGQEFDEGWNSAAEGQAEKKRVPADPETGIPPDDVLKEEAADDGASE